MFRSRSLPAFLWPPLIAVWLLGAVLGGPALGRIVLCSADGPRTIAGEALPPADGAAGACDHACCPAPGTPLMVAATRSLAFATILPPVEGAILELPRPPRARPPGRGPPEA
ncbi:MAG: hypothetical protein FJX02_16020 [Alphaproteobacteria bacterium]|nr:hypothetical protein [Alphaproteobacteria bacterium]